MPHVNGRQSATASSVDSKENDDLASADEVKVYKDEGEDEKRSSENLIEDKLGLVTESEEGKGSDVDSRKSYSGDDSVTGQRTGIKSESLLSDRFPFGYPFIPPYPPFANGASLTSPGKLFGAHTGAFGLWDPIGPPPAHMGITPLHLDLKSGLSRHPLYGLHPAASLYPPELAHLQWGVASGSPFRPYAAASPLSWLGGPGLLPGVSHPAVVTPGPPSSLPHDLSPLSDPLDGSREQPFFLSKHLDSPHSRLNGGHPLGGHNPYHHQNPPQPKKPAIKKPLNAFMIFMKEMRQSVIEECSLKESAAINQILGRRWHSLDRSEQAKYYEMARKEKELHMKMYPGWSARDNYATHTKRKKLKHQPHHHRPPHSNHSNAESSHSYDSSEHASSPSAKRLKSHYSHDDGPGGNGWNGSGSTSSCFFGIRFCNSMESIDTSLDWSDSGSVDGGVGGENMSLLANGLDHLTNVSLDRTLTPSTPSRIAV